MALHCNNHQAHTIRQMSYTDRPASISAKGLPSSARGQCKFHQTTSNPQCWRTADLDRWCSANTHIRLRKRSTPRPLCIQSLAPWCNDPALGNRHHPQNPTGPWFLPAPWLPVRPRVVQAPHRPLLVPRQPLLAPHRPRRVPRRVCLEQLRVRQHPHRDQAAHCHHQRPAQAGEAGWAGQEEVAHMGGPQLMV